MSFTLGEVVDPTDAAASSNIEVQNGHAVASMLDFVSFASSKRI